jgi:hypothetical protein
MVKLILLRSGIIIIYIYYSTLIYVFLFVIRRFPNQRKIVLYAHGTKQDILCPINYFKQPLEFIYFTLTLSCWDVDDVFNSIRVYVKVYFFFF